MNILYISTALGQASWLKKSLDLNKIEIEEIRLNEELEKAILDGSFSLLVLDLDGFTKLGPALQVISKIKACASLPLLVVATNLTEDLVVESLRKGVDNFILKSSTSRLLAYIEELEANMPKSFNSQQVLNTLINEVSDVIWVKDLKGKYLLINSAGADFIRKPMLDILGKDDYEVFVPETADKIRITDQEVMTTGKTVTFESQLVALEGKTRYFMAVKTAYKDDSGNIQGVLGIIRDITERKHMEEDLKAAKELAETANARKSEFLTSMSHELRTPLHTIITSTDMALEGFLGALPNQVHTYMQSINESGRHLLKLIDDLLDISKIEAGKFVLQKSSLNLHAFIRDIVVLVEALYIQKGQKLNVIIDPTAPDRFEADPIRLKQALCNLLSNAHKFSSEGTQVTLHCHTQQRGACLIFSVKDQGLGIAKQDIQRLLEPFEQGHIQNDSYIKGTGLGLAITNRIVELHGGKLKVRSTPGKGSTFLIQIPVRVKKPDVLKKPLISGILRR